MSLFVICDAKNNLMQIDSVPVLGRLCSIPAIFNKEEDALATLFTIEKLKLTDVPHMVQKLANGFSAVREMS